ncbi:Uncharacterised protein [Mycobacteroides abscessus subsp. abscessus]|nr:Uncharacterised protein [Mycobacteroides abscessus]SHT95880.1 Uncharacterised protein [Mycobacteroides abscessus subsp. abscessus]
MNTPTPTITVSSEFGMVSASPVAVMTIAATKTEPRPLRSASRPATADDMVPARYSRKSRPAMAVGSPNGGATRR